MRYLGQEDLFVTDPALRAQEGREPVQANDQVGAAGDMSQERGQPLAPLVGREVAAVDAQESPGLQEGDEASRSLVGQVGDHGAEAHPALPNENSVAAAPAVQDASDGVEELIVLRLSPEG